MRWKSSVQLRAKNAFTPVSWGEGEVGDWINFLFSFFYNVQMHQDREKHCFKCDSFQIKCHSGEEQMGGDYRL